MDEVRRLGRMARQWGGLLGLGALAGALAFVVLSVRHPPSYHAQATVAVVSAVSGTESDPFDVELAGALVDTYRLTVASHAVLSDVIGTLHLRTTPAALAGQLTVAPVPGTTLLTIDTYQADAAAAARLVNTVAEQFVRRATLNRAAPIAAQRAALAARQAANEGILQTALTRQATLRAIPARALAEQQELERLDAEIAASLLTRSTLLRQLDDLRQIQALNAVPARVVDRAGSSTPVPARGLFSVGMAALGGGLAAGLVLWVLAFTAGTLTGVEEVRAALRLPVLGIIPREK